MRGLILVLILLVVGAIALVATGYVNIDQTRGAQVPKVGVGDNGVVLRGGQAPKFDVETGQVKVVPPRIEVTPRGNEAAPPPVTRTPAPAPAAPPPPSAPATTDSTQR